MSEPRRHLLLVDYLTRQAVESFSAVKITIIEGGASDRNVWLDRIEAIERQLHEFRAAYKALDEFPDREPV